MRKHFLRCLRILHPVLDVLAERFPAALQRHDEIPALADDRLRRLALRVHRVRGGDRSPQVHHVEQRRQRPDLVGLPVDLGLAEHEPGANAPARCSAERSATRRKARRTALPSIAVCRTPSFSGAFAHFLANRADALPNGFGSMRRNTPGTSRGWEVRAAEA